MSYIYVITNDINDKKYVGKTNCSIEKRFQEHIWDSRRERCEKRPLYNAMNKYGVEHFSIKQLEKCSPEEAATKEIYWIGKLNTYENGYNATLGGDSKQYYNYDEIINKYLELKNQKETAKYFNCDIDTVLRACRAKNIETIPSQEVNKSQFGKKVFLIEKELTFDTIREAARFLQDNNITYNKSIGSIAKNISHVCTGERQSAYKLHWKFI